MQQLCPWSLSKAPLRLASPKKDIVKRLAKVFLAKHLPRVNPEPYSPDTPNLGPALPCPAYPHRKQPSPHSSPGVTGLHPHTRPATIHNRRKRVNVSLCEAGARVQLTTVGGLCLRNSRMLGHFQRAGAHAPRGYMTTNILSASVKLKRHDLVLPCGVLF